MTLIAKLMNGLFDLLAAPFGGSAEWAVFVLSLLVGLVLLLLFKAATNQDKLVAARQVLTGRVYEMGLFQDHLGVLFKIQRDLLLANLRYLRYSFPALLVLLIPTVLILAQMDAHYGHRPFQPGEKALVTVTVEPGQPMLLRDMTLETPTGLTVEAGPLRNVQENSVSWRVGIDAEGRHDLAVLLPGQQRVSKLLVAGEGTPRLAVKREKESLLRILLNPAEDPLPKDQPVEAIALRLPARDLHYAGLGMHWLVALCIFSLAFGLAVKDLFKVRF